MELTKNKILKLSIELSKKYKRYPTTSEMLTVGVTRDLIRYHFGNITNLHSIIYNSSETIFDLHRESKLNTINKNTKRFVITTAVIGADADARFLKNIKAYCKDEDAQLIVLPSVPNGSIPFTLDPALRSAVVVMEDTMLNDNVFILGIKNNSKTSDPITGLARIGRRNGTFIAASPKQRLKYVATGIDRLAHAIMSTGAITVPSYSKALLVDKTSYVAHQDHVMGAIIVELDKDDTFHFRQIKADQQGSFVDLGTLYKNGRRATMAPSAFILGDWHSGETDENAAKCWKDVTVKLKVPEWVIHDGFSGNSINHHNQYKKLTLAKMADEKLLSLESELKGYSKDLLDMSKLLKRVTIVKSNHDEFLDRYLQESRYVDDPQNHTISLKLASALIEGHNPIKYYMNNILGLEKRLGNVQWLERDEDYSIAGIQCGAHGDKGADGGRGNINSLENAYGDVVFGHIHTPQIQRGAWAVGTSSKLKLGYNQGPSSWFHTSCLIYPNGQRQLINCIGDGKWTTRKI